MVPRKKWFPRIGVRRVINHRDRSSRLFWGKAHNVAGNAAESMHRRLSPEHFAEQFLKIACLKVVERDSERDKQIQRGVAHHRRAWGRCVRKWAELYGSRQ